MNTLPAQIEQANNIAIQAIQALQAINAQQAAKIEELEPKAAEYERFLECRDTMDMASAASRISEVLGVKIGRTNLYKMMRNMGLMWQTKNHVLREYEERGYFKNGSSAKNGEFREYIRVTPKGLAWLAERLDDYIQHSGDPIALIARQEMEGRIHE